MPSGREDLAKLFERFVLEYYRAHFPGLRPSGSTYVDHGIDDAPVILPHLMTDIILRVPGRTLIIDTKCYGSILSTHHEKGILRPEHRNQILSYVVHKGCDPKAGEVSGMLLYAGTEHEDAVSATWHEVGHEFAVRTLDLGCEFGKIASQLDAIAEGLAE